MQQKVNLSNRFLPYNRAIVGDDRAIAKGGGEMKKCFLKIGTFVLCVIID